MFMSNHFVLASASPRRREFLQHLNIPFTVITPRTATKQGEVDETPLPNEPPTTLVQRLSRSKAEAVVNNLPKLLSLPNKNIIIIAADTVVVLKDTILGKPNNEATARQMLKALREHPHYVYSGLTVAYIPHFSSTTALKEAIYITRLHQSKVWMRPYTDAEISTYIAGGSPLDKAGAYGIQDKNFTPVQCWKGCFSSIMGLPLAELASALAEIKVTLPQIAPICSQFGATFCCQSPG